jgi:hypothetical protein
VALRAKIAVQHEIDDEQGEGHLVAAHPPEQRWGNGTGREQIEECPFDVHR